MVLYAADAVPDAVLERLSALRPGADPAELVAVGPDRLRTRLEGYVTVDFSKLVVVPLGEPGSGESWDTTLGAVADAVLDLQT
jgi:hypothetical protein